MKPSSKAVMIGCISFFVFLYGNLLFGGLVGSLIPGGDDFINSYFYPLYTAVTLLISLIISCTYLILKKINLLLDKMEEKKTCVSQIGIDRAEREGCLLPERQEDGSRRKQKIIFYMKGWLQNVKTKYL